MAGRLQLSGLTVLLLVLAPSASAKTASAKTAPFMAGAATLETTPPAAGSQAGSSADSQFGPSKATCPPAVYPDEGIFALQEPGNAAGYCDANANGRRDQLYADNGKGLPTGVHDPLEVRAFAISDGHRRPVVYASVDQIGIFDYYTEEARSVLASTYKVDADLVVSADHNESSPDSIGLYGAYSQFEGIGLRSGIDEYFMRFLADRIAHAAADAVHAMKPANLYANQVGAPLPPGASGSAYPLLKGMSQRISDQFPTSVALGHDDRVAAVDPKLGVLQARAATKPGRGRPIFTVMSLAAHNQEMGNAGAAFSADWPGAFERAYDAKHAGTTIFLVADNGSEEDPQTNPTVINKGSENHTNQATQYIQAQATGARFAQLTDAAARGAQPIRPGAVTLTRKQICVPLENNGFVALAAAGEFGMRQGYVCDSSGNPQHAIPNGSVIPTASTKFRTFIAFTDVGPDVQFIDIPGEAFPALMTGSPFGVSDESCPRPNPAVPVWHASAAYRFQVGLADDLIGYLIPAWGFASGTPGLFSNDSCYQDMNGHGHKLESESVGPTGANDVANGLASMLGASHPDPTARVVTGRFVQRDGTLSRWPTGAVAVQLQPGGMLIGAPRTAGFTTRAVDETGVFMDYDGQPQARPDITTRGIMLLARNGCPTARYYLNVFPDLPALPPLGAVKTQRRILPPKACSTRALQPLAAAHAGLALAKSQRKLARVAGPFAVRRPRRACRARLRPPRIVVHGRRVSAIPRGGCSPRIARITVEIGGVQVLVRGRLPGSHHEVRAFDTNELEAARVA